MSIDLNELTQHEEPWLAYGARRASRIRRKKRTNADVAMNLDVQAVTKKIEAHDKRFAIVRWMIRRLTKIERERELLVYRLGSEVLTALKASSTMATLKAQQPNLAKITSVMARASWFSWFKKPLNAFMGWVGQKTAELELMNQPEAQQNMEADGTQASVQVDAIPTPAVVLPVEPELDTVVALERFREKVTKDKRAIVEIYSKCEASFRKMSNMTTAEQAEGFDASFEPFKKKLRELQVYYHPDKALPERAKTVGLKHETLKAQVAIAFTEIIKPVYEAIIVKRDKLKGSIGSIGSIEQSLGFDRLLEEISEGIQKNAKGIQEIVEGIRELKEANKEADLAFSRSVDELCEMNVRRNEELTELGKVIERQGDALSDQKRQIEEQKSYFSSRLSKSKLTSQLSESNSKLTSRLSEFESKLNGMFELVQAAALAGNYTLPPMNIPGAEEPVPNKQSADGGVTLPTSPMLSTFPNALFARTSPGACGQQHSAANKDDAVPSVLVH